jgi:membrane protease YdiL (CAAX protease family)
MKASHLLVFFILLMGVGDQVFILRLKLTHGPKARLHAYWLILSWLWLATIAAAWIIGPRAVWYASLNPGEGKWLPGSLVAGLIAFLSLAVLLTPVVVVARKPSAAFKLANALDRLRFFLPATPRERFWWALLSITAGICEETLFRSFLLQYLRADPWRLGLAGAVAVASLLFALGHLYQGIAAAIGTGLLAVLFFILFLGSGSLLIPMLLHALADLRVLLLLRLADAQPPK